MLIKKRTNELEVFDKKKIISAINKAFLEVDKKVYENDTAIDIANEIENKLLTKDTPTVEETQDLVEEYLMRSERPDVARAYIRYRYKKEVARNHQEDFIKAIREKLEAKDIQNDNANMDEHSFGGRTGAAGDVVWKKIALDYIVSEKARENHINNRIYIHDLSSYAVGNHNCLSIPFDDILANGFSLRQSDIRPAGSVGTAFQLLAVIFQVQSLQQFGGVSATHLDWTMVPYVRKSFFKHYKKGLKFLHEFTDDEIKEELKDINKTEISIQNTKIYHYGGAYKYAMAMTEEEIEQSVEGLYHNLNSLQSRSGNQLPFSSVNYGTCTLPEGRMVIKAMLEGSLAGIGKVHRTSIFPCNIFQVMKGVNKEPGTPNYDLFRLALKSTAHRLYPNYCNVDWSGNAGYDVNDPRTYNATMGKRKLSSCKIF